MASAVDSIQEWAGLQIRVVSIRYLREQQDQGNPYHVGSFGFGVVPALALRLQDIHLVRQLLHYHAARWHHHPTFGPLLVLLNLRSQHLDVPSTL